MPFQPIECSQFPLSIDGYAKAHLPGQPPLSGATRIRLVVIDALGQALSIAGPSISF